VDVEATFAESTTELTEFLVRYLRRFELLDIAVRRKRN
jgi:hypothetical protein